MANEELLKKAVEAFKALTPEQQAEILEKQRQSWVRGNVGLSRDERGITTPVMPHPAAPVEGLDYDKIISHVNSYGTTHEEDHRRLYTKCQLDLAIRLSSKSNANNPKVDELETVVVSYGNKLVTRSQAEAIIAAERAQTDAYGIALMMIREGCENPSDIARKALERFGK